MKKQLFITLYLVLSIWYSTRAQSLEWLIETNTGAPTALELDKQGSIYLAAPSQIIKYDSAGAVVWQETFISTGGAVFTQLAIDTSGNLYIAGRGGGDVTLFDTSIVDNNGTFLLKMKGPDSLLWLKNFNKSQFYKMKNDINGNLYLAGLCPEYTVFESCIFTSVNDGAGFLSKFNDNGQCQWIINALVIGNFWYNDFDLTIDRLGNIYTTGGISSGFLPYFPWYGLTTAGDIDVFHIKYNASGNFTWAKTAGGFLHDGGIGISHDGSGNIYVTGVVEHDEELWPDKKIMFDTIQVFAKRKDMFLAKYDSTGKCLWARTAGNDEVYNTYFDGLDYGRAVYADKRGYIYVTGNYASKAFLNKFDSKGNLLWEMTSEGGNGMGKAITGDGYGTVYLTGTFGWTPFSFGGQEFTGNGGVFLAKLIDPDTLKPDPTSIQDPAQGNPELRVFPNPSGRVFNIYYKAGALTTATLQLSIKNTLGQTIFNKTYKNVNGELHDRIDTGNLSKGIYFLEITDGKNREVKRVVLN